MMLINYTFLRVLGFTTGLNEKKNPKPKAFLFYSVYESSTSYVIKQDP